MATFLAPTAGRTCPGAEGPNLLPLSVYTLRAALASLPLSSPLHRSWRCSTVARCAVRWFTRGPNLENHCKDLDDYFKEMPGRLTAHMNEAGYHLTQHRASLNLNDAEKRYLDSDSPLCLDTTGDLLCLYIVALSSSPA